MYVCWCVCVCIHLNDCHISLLHPLHQSSDAGRQEGRMIIQPGLNSFVKGIKHA